VIMAPDPASEYVLELDQVSKLFGTVVALKDVTLRLRRGEVHCLLGDNGAGKSTLIKILAGVHPPSLGTYRVDAEPVAFDSPRDALDRGIATVYQDLALVPLMSVCRNFFLGREPTRMRWGIFRVFDRRLAAKIASERLADLGILVRDDEQAVGTMSGGERQCLAIARARDKGVSVIFITHNVHHAYPVGDTFTLLDRGRSMGTFKKGEISRDEVLNMMAGGQEMQAVMSELG